jgi:hypothetical protein
MTRYWFSDDDIQHVPPARPSRPIHHRFKSRSTTMPMVKAIRSGFAAGHFRAAGEVFDAPATELALVHDDAEHGWQELIAPDATACSAHLAALGDQAHREAGKRSLVTLRPPGMPATPPII